jgi:purine-cytosine permease-like protein
MGTSQLHARGGTLVVSHYVIYRGLLDDVPDAIGVILLRREALLAIAIGYAILSIVVVLNGTIGARLHVSFPVLNRSSFGFWFSYFSVISRTILSMFWFGIQVLFFYVIFSLTVNWNIIVLYWL